MWISKYVCLFMCYSFLGWIYETVYCTIKDGKWENRGFLYGPVVPIYGCGAMAVTILVHFSVVRGVMLTPLLLYIICVVGSAILEYVTSWTLEKMFHALWWDYSGMPLNIQGRTSLFTSLGFGFGGLLIVYVIAPFLEEIVYEIPPIVTELLSLCVIFVFAVDITLTVTALHNFDKIVIRAEDSFNQSMSSIVDDVVLKANHVKQSILTRGTAVTDQMNSMSAFAKKTIHRVYVFRDENKRVEATKNKLLSLYKKLSRNSDDKNDEVKRRGCV